MTLHSKMDSLEETRTRVSLKELSVINTRTTDFPGNYTGYDDAWHFEKFKQKLKIKINRLEGHVLEFDLVGIDASIANAFRRILIAEIPTMAVEKVFVYNNTSIIPDEILAHRLGLIPFKADSRLFEYKPMVENNKPTKADQDCDKATAEDTIEYHLKVRCSRRPNAAKDATSKDELYVNHSVYSGDIKWIPIGEQESMYREEDMGPVHKDILIARLQPGHEIDVKMHCVKGIGKDHAKFSPVAPASYRLLPEIILTKPIMNEAADRLKSCFSEGVIGIEETKHGRMAVVLNARKDTCSRNVFRHEDLKSCVKMNKIRDHFIFAIESTGALPPNVLFREAIGLLKLKCKTFLAELDLVHH